MLRIGGAAGGSVEEVILSVKCGWMCLVSSGASETAYALCSVFQGHDLYSKVTGGLRNS